MQFQLPQTLLLALALASVGSAQTAIRGRVMHAGQPVAGAEVRLSETPLAPGARRTRRAARRFVHSDQDGYFELLIIPIDNSQAGLYESTDYCLSAWDKTLGEGLLGPIQIFPWSPPHHLRLNIDHAPGSIKGRVIFPDGRGPEDIWLSTSRSRNYTILKADGSYELKGLPAGPLTVQIYKVLISSPGAAQSYWHAPDAERGRLLNSGNWKSRGPQRAPQWLHSNPHLEVLVPSNGTLALDLDLSQPARCFVRAKVTLDGAPPAPRNWPSAHTNQRVNGLRMIENESTGCLVSTGRGQAHSLKLSESRPLHNKAFLHLGGKLNNFAAFDEDAKQPGVFDLAVHAPGRYLLVSHIPALRSGSMQLRQWLDLRPGTLEWEPDIRLGQLIVELDPAWPSTSRGRMRLVQRTPAGLEITCTTDSSWGQVTRFNAAPAGPCELIIEPRRFGEPITLQVHVIAGTTTRIRLGAQD